MSEVMTVTASRINKCFAEQTHQGDVLIALYKLLYGKRLWDQIEVLVGWPKAGAEVHQYISECFIRFDKAYHPDGIAGGLWLNNGWSGSQDVGPWEVKLTPYTLTEEADENGN